MNLESISGNSVRGYEVHEIIGHGGAGTVYRAHQPAIKRDVALKVIVPEYANNPEFIRIFEMEAQLIARLEHLHIVPLYDFWREPDGAFLIMRLLRGGSLQAMIENNPISVEDSVRIIGQVADALTAAHRSGIIHRDIKPGNILIDNDGNAFLSDFGIAKDLLSITTTQSEDEHIAGTPAYLSPEQAQGFNTIPQSDIYSLGLVAYEMLIGKLNSKAGGSIWETIRNHVNTTLPSVLHQRPELPEAVDLVLLQATAPDPESRYASALQFAQAFQQCLMPQAFPQQLKEESDDGIIIEVNIDNNDQIENPYKGLRAFIEADAQDFFGRQTLVEQLESRIRDQNFLAVIGPSGSGKSSVVRAGLVPKLRKGAITGSDQWYIVDMVPSHAPFQELKNALLGIATERYDNLLQTLMSDKTGLQQAVQKILPPEAPYLLIVIDQFEEIFTQVENEDIRQQFLSIIHHVVINPTCRIKIIVTMRADFYDRPLQYPEFGELIRSFSEVVLPLNEDEMREAIVGPAENVGLKVEPALVKAIINEVSNQPGALPLLQYALTESFERRSGAFLSYAGYESAGGALGALASRAEEIFMQLSQPHRDLARQIFLRLVTLGEGTEDTRRRIELAVLYSIGDDPDAVQQVLDRFSRHRLLTFDRDPDTRNPTVEVAHEALIREWSRLRRWLNESRDDLRRRQKLSFAVYEWKQQNRDDSYLARGNRLTQFEELTSKGNITLSADEIAYIGTSIDHSRQLAEAEAERKEKELKLERRAKQRARTIAAILTVASVIGIFLTVLLYNQSEAVSEERDIAQLARDNAQQARDEAIVARQTSDANAVYAEEQANIAAEQALIAQQNSQQAESLAFSTIAQQALNDGFYNLAVAFGLEAMSIDNPPQVAIDTLEEIAHSPGLQFILEGEEDSTQEIIISPDNRYMLTAYRNFSISAGPNVLSGPPANNTGENNGSGPPGQGPNQGGGPAGGGPGQGGNGPGGSPESPEPIIVWDLNRGEVIGELIGHQSAIADMLFLPPAADVATRVVSLGTNGELIIWDVENLSVITRFQVHAPGRAYISYCESTNLLLTVRHMTSESDSQQLWDMESLEQIRIIPTVYERVVSGVLSPDGKFGISLYHDGTQVVWDVETGETISEITLEFDDIRIPSFKTIISADSQTAVTNAGSQTVIVWDINTATIQNVISPQFSAIRDIALDAIGNELFILDRTGSLLRWDIRGNTPISTITDTSGDATYFAFNSNNDMVAIVFDSTNIHVWNLNESALNQISEMPRLADRNDFATYLPDGTLLYTGGNWVNNSYMDSFAYRIDPETNTVIQTYDQDTPEYYVTNAFDVSDDGSFFAIGLAANLPGVILDESIPVTTTIYDIESGEIVWQIILPTHENIIDVEFIDNDPETGHPRLAILDPGRVQIMDIETRQVLFVDNSIENNALSYSDTENILYVNNLDDTIVGFDTENFEIVREFEIPSDNILFELSPGGSEIITYVEEEFELIMWDSETGEEVAEFYGHTAPVKNVAFSPDGNLMVSGDVEGFIILWDIETEQILSTFDFHFTEIRSLEFSSDSEQFMSLGGGDGLAFWSPQVLTGIELVEWVEANRYIPELTESVCNLYGIGDLCGESSEEDD